MKKSDIKELQDKNLQLRYFLGGLQDMTNNEHCHYWNCDINCSCNIVPDDERLDAVKKFIKNHNINNERFLKLAYHFLFGAIMKYHGSYSQLFLELEEVLKPYQFTQSNKKEIPDNNLREKELEELVHSSNEPDSIVGNFIKKYNLTAEDFIVLLKTFINHNIFSLRFKPNDTFINEVIEITQKYELTVTRDFLEEYRKEYEAEKENAELIVETKSTQKRYLELLKKLLIKDNVLANEVINEGLLELGFEEKKVKKLLKSNKSKLHL